MPTEALVNFRRRRQKREAARIREELDAGSRAPFKSSLAETLMEKPDSPAIKRFANRYPDRWASMVATLARLAGYHDKTEETKTLNILISRMSDQEVLKNIAKLEGELTAEERAALDLPPVIEGKAVELDS